MADALEFADAVLGAVVDALSPLEAAASDEAALLELLDELGWLPPSQEVDPAAVTPLGTIASTLTDVKAAVDSYQASGQINPQTLKQLVSDVVGLLSQIQQLSAIVIPTNLPPPLSSQSFWAAMASELAGYLLARYLRRNNSILLLILRCSGILDQVPSQSDNNRVDGQLVDSLRWDRLTKLISDPVSLMSDVYGWGGTLQFGTLFQRFEEVLIAVGLSAFEANPGQEVIDRHYGVGTLSAAILPKLRVPLFKGDGSWPYVELGVDTLPVPLTAGSSNPSGLFISPYGSVALPAQIAVNDELSLNFSGTVDGSGAVGVILLPGSISAFVDTGALTGDLKVELQYTPSSPVTLIGDPSATGVSIGGAALGFELRTAGATIAEGLVSIRLSTVKVSVDFSQADGFLSTVTNGLKGGTQFDLLVGWSTKRGLYFDGGGGLERVFPLQLSLGPLQIESIDVRVGPDGNDIVLSGAVTAGLALGPIAASVENVGALAKLATGTSGAFFGLAPSFGFKFPDGLGLSIDAGAVAGGGFILFDQDKGEYAGFLDISIAEIIQVKFIAILDTKLPDGSKGFSLLFIIFMELPPIQLGFGFTLNGVGGVAGVNRSMSSDGLRAGLRNHTLDYVIAPPRTVADAPKVISAVSSFFPVAKDRYVFGPILALGWETFIQLTVGVILEVPDPIKLVLLGIIDAGLPEIDEALIKIHIDILGILDFGNKKFSLDGSMYDSYVLEFPIAGDLALRMSWGNVPNFVFSLGGFNPHFNTTGLDVPQLKRLSISIGDGDNPRIIATSYMALTSNTAQFGANVEAWASAAGFSVHGYLGFDVLFIFSPSFAFEFDFSAGFDISFHGASLAGITLSGVLSGTNPWHLHGDASFHILFFDVSKSVDLTWGDPNPPALPQRSVLDDLLPALNDPQNWNSILPDSTRQSATLSAPKPDQKTILVHPMGTLSVIEKVVPLDLPISRYNNATPSDGNYFSLGSVQVNSGNASKETFQDFFAAGQFLDLSDADKLSRSSFEPHDAGAKIGSAAVASGANSPRTVSYNEYYIDDPVLPLRISPNYIMPSDVFQALSHQSAGFLSPLKNTGLNKYKIGPSTPAATTKDPAYVVASVDNLTVRSDIVGAGGATYYQARAALNAHLAKNPQDAGNLQILPAHEVTP